MTHFYLTLPSNSCMEYYPQNKPQNYKIKLSKPLDLTGADYEVGVAEIQYPHTWHTIDQYNNDIYFTYLHASNKTSLHVERFSIPIGIYKSINELIQSINQAIEPTFFSLKILPFSFKTVISALTMTISRNGTLYNFYEFEMSHHLCRLLGFNEAKVDDFKNTSYTEVITTLMGDTKKNLTRFNKIDFANMDETYTSHYPSDINRGVYSLFIYSDIISRQVVGDTHAPLLCTIPIDSTKQNCMVNTRFNLPHYLPVPRQLFDTLEIDIRDDTGSPILFTYGKVLLKLHFRLRRSPYFE